MILDPELQETQPPQSRPEISLPMHQHDDPENASDDGEDNEANEKRRKLNLLKCQQCRAARKKCLPEDREWPQKCLRCLQHKPDELECSQPQLNLRKRGPNLSKAAQRSKSRPTPEPQEVPPAKIIDDFVSKKDDEEEKYERPSRTQVVKTMIKREHELTLEPAVKTPPPVISRDDEHPASAYLPLGERDFRILWLRPGRRDDKVVYSFTIATIGGSKQKYEAISYVWAGGSAMPQTSVDIRLMDNHGKSFPIYIRSNLHSALRSLRHPKDARAFWIDALCVNHSNAEERSRQVAMKRYIFHNAQNLCFWLGEDEDSKNALAFIPRILDLTKIDELVKDDTAIDGWVSFVNLLKHTAFSRLWLVQEVAVAQNVTLHCGQPAIHYGDLVDAVAMFLSFREDISTLFRRNQKNSRQLQDRKMRIAERFIDVSTNALRLTNPEKVQRLLTLEDLVSHLADLTSTDPRDRIFSILAIAKDGPKLAEETLMTSSVETQQEGTLRLDYNQDVLEVYQDFVIHAITKSQSLDIICRHWASSVSEKEAALPTWVRPLQSSLQPTFDSNMSERTDPDSLVGLPDHNYYHASRGTSISFRIEQPLSFPTTASKSLFAKGFRVDTISKLGPRASEGIILYEWLGLGGCVSTDSAPEDFWRTLVADRGPNGTHAPSWYTRAFLYCLIHLTPTGDINTNRLIAACEAESTQSSLVVDFLQRVQSVIWNRKFLVSRNNAWKGLAPMAAQSDDVIAILYGCSVPVVLRPQRDGYGEEWYQLVGECYVHGLMDGEAVEMQVANPSVYLEEEFELR